MSVGWRCFRDHNGETRIGWVVAEIVGVILLGVGLLLAVVMFAIVKPLNEAACNQKASALASQGVGGGDYRVLSDTCYLTLKNGRVIPADQLRAIVKVR